jgi:hypothetical protein
MAAAVDEAVMNVTNSLTKKTNAFEYHHHRYSR